MMRISLAVPFIFEDEKPDIVANCIEKAAEIGYSAVEPMVRDPKKINVEALRRILNRVDMHISGFRTGTMYSIDGLNLSDADSKVRDRAVARLQDAAALCAEFPGSKVLNGLMQGPPKQGERTAAKISLVTESLRRVCEVAEKHNVDICLEAVNRYELAYNNTLDDIRKVIEDSGSSHLQMLIDTFHMNIEEVDICASILRNYTNIGAVHCADSNRLAPGMGHIDFRKVIACLHETGYDEYLTVEMPGETSGYNNRAYDALSNIVKEL